MVSQTGQTQIDNLDDSLSIVQDVTAPDANEVGRGNFLLVTNERMTRTH